MNTTKGDQRFVGQKYPKGGNTGSHSHGPAEATGSNKNRRLPESRVDKSTNNRGTGGKVGSGSRGSEENYDAHNRGTGSKVGSVSHGSEENFDGHNHGAGGKVGSFSRGAGGKVGSFNLGEGGKVSSFNRGPGAKVNSSSRGSKENDGNSHNHDSDDYTGYYQIFFIFSFPPRICSFLYFIESISRNYRFPKETGTIPKRTSSVAAPKSSFVNTKTQELFDLSSTESSGNSLTKNITESILKISI